MFSWLIEQMKRRNLVPAISDTERAALDAGTVWVEGDLFSGRPDFRHLMEESYPQLTDAERAFIDGPVDDVCRMASTWELVSSREVTPEIMEFLREHRFFGLQIPTEYGGHGFSSLALSTIFGMLGTHSMTLNAIVVIPNSIGPAELITHYGTDEQKQHYLPRLARGLEIPCFALTEPNAGSDAASLTSSGVLFRKDDGTLAIRLQWDKRYITLAPIGTLLGLAFRLYDPENHLGRGEDLGITCGLVSTHLPGVEIGRRHDPMGTPFPNGPTRGKDVVVDADTIIGGPERAGQGWQMLMESLSGGRAISLPAGATAGAKAITRWVGAYAFVRQQFGMPIGRFEGIEEPLARIAGRTYLMEAARVYTCGAVNAGQKPAVVSAIAKYNLTDLARQTVCDGMDVLGGKGICRGPRNPLADGYAAAPIGITVEGANILTRTLIVFGQGALRCHPYLQREVRAIEEGDGTELRRALFGHTLFVLRNGLLALLHGLTRGFFASGRPLRRPVARYVRRLKWASATFAFLADLVVASSGPNLKQKGKMTGRFADILSWMYLATAVLRRYEAEGRQKDDLPLVHWGIQTALAEIQAGFQGILANFGSPILGWPVRFFGLRWFRFNPIGTPPSDRLGAAVARIPMTPGAQRDRLTGEIFLPDPSESTGVLDRALELAHQAEPISRRIKKALRRGEISPGSPAETLARALEKEIVTAEEANLLTECEEARTEVLRVDDFSPEEFFGRSVEPAAALEPAGV